MCTGTGVHKVSWMVTTFIKGPFWLNAWEMEGNDYLSGLKELCRNGKCSLEKEEKKSYETCQYVSFLLTLFYCFHRHYNVYLVSLT